MSQSPTSSSSHSTSPAPPGASIPRRTFLGGTGLLLAAGAAGAAFGSSAIPGTTPAAGAAVGEGRIRRRPNIVIIMTDQERRPMFWPEGWAAQNLPQRQRLIDTGLSFNLNACNSTMCSPSRSTMFTGVYPAQHGVYRTLTSGGSLSDAEPQLSPTTPNMAGLLASAGYDVHYRGKWHMSKGADGLDPTPADVESFGFHGWSPPEAGQDIKPENFGGGTANNDQRYADEAVGFLNSVPNDPDRPFALVASFANPHDILAYPQTWDLTMPDGGTNYLDAAPGCFQMGIDLPPTFTEVLALNHKPRAQTQINLASQVGLGALVGEEKARNYANLYAYMQQVVDQHIGAVIDAVESNDLRRDTIIIQVSDHGEMAMSHGGMRQKVFNAYEETMLVPLVISNPGLFPTGVTTDALSSLVDLMPTLATIAEVAPEVRAGFGFRGTDLSPIISDAVENPGAPTREVQDVIHYVFDDDNIGQPDGQTSVTQPNHLRTVRDRTRKFTMYFDPQWVELPVFEMYDLAADPLELRNLANPFAPLQFRADMFAEMLPVLLAQMAEKGTTPAGMPADLPLPTGPMGSLGSVGS
ncbi:sulfatase-like hydrolase/transferase [Dietzia natronolimnaea]|uniref:sulfatase-like hydrolase/transferase n=1 Tax=Dietzia natronolimnaea TaxID=161920 RepID=UPI003D0A76DE